MKKLKKVITVILAVFLILFFGAVGVRIWLNGYYPKASLNVYYTEELKNYYNKNNGLPGAITQDLRFKYNFVYGEKEDSDIKQDGAFFADGLVYTPDAENVQITVRTNKGSSLDKVKKTYFGWGMAEKEETLALADISYTLTVSYYDDETKLGQMKTYTPSYRGNQDFAVYTYEKLVFDGVEKEVDGLAVRWMRLDIKWQGKARDYGVITLFETKMEIDGEMLPVDTEAYVPGKEEKP